MAANTNSNKQQNRGKTIATKGLVLNKHDRKAGAANLMRHGLLKGKKPAYAGIPTGCCISLVMIIVKRLKSTSMGFE